MLMIEAGGSHLKFIVKSRGRVRARNIVKLELFRTEKAVSKMRRCWNK